MIKPLTDGLTLYHGSSDQKYGVVTSYVYKSNTALKEKLFQEADAEWLHCVVAHRKTGSFEEIRNNLAPFDVVGGKIANDALNNLNFKESEQIWM